MAHEYLNEETLTVVDRARDLLREYSSSKWKSSTRISATENSNVCMVLNDNGVRRALKLPKKRTYQVQDVQGEVVRGVRTSASSQHNISTHFPSISHQLFSTISTPQAEPDISQPPSTSVSFHQYAILKTSSSSHKSPTPPPMPTIYSIPTMTEMYESQTYTSPGQYPNLRRISGRM
jgi:hypothetical protein